MHVLRVLNESTAALIPSAISKASDERIMHVLLIDLGATSLNVICYEVEDGIYDPFASSHDFHLGGDSFDRVLVEHCKQVFT